MKIRNGFVSNSSSSSYIICNDIEAVTTHMLNVIIKDYKDFDKETKITNVKTYNKWKRNLKSKLKDIEVQNGKTGISFPSTNYRTYVLKVGQNCHIATCNNQYWDFAENFNVLFAGYGEDEGESDLPYKSIKNKYFYYIENGLMLSTHLYFDTLKKNSRLNKYYCKKCKMNSFCFVESTEGLMYCGYCYKEILGHSPLAKERKEHQRFEKKKREIISKVNAFSHIEII